MISERLQFTVPAIPIAQPRPRAVSVGGKARVFGAPKTHAIHAFKATVRCTFANARRESTVALSGPVSLKMLFVLPRPKLPKKVGVDRLPHCKRPDFDNLCKGVVDALNGLAWNDDSQICRMECSKEVAAENEQPHVEIDIAWGLAETRD